MLENTGFFRLIDLCTNDYNGKTYYYGNVYYSHEGRGNMIKVGCTAEEFALLQQYLNQDVTNIIVIRFNHYREAFIPVFKLN